MIPIALRHLRLPVLLGLVMQCAGCSTQQPVLYPNQHYTTVGDAVAQGDIDACMTRAKEYVKAGGADAQKAEVAKQTGFGAASGAAIGAVGGAVGVGPGRARRWARRRGRPWGLFTACSAQKRPIPSSPTWSIVVSARRGTSWRDGSDTAARRPIG